MNKSNDEIEIIEAIGKIVFYGFIDFRQGRLKMEGLLEYFIFSYQIFAKLPGQHFARAILKDR